MSSSKEHNNWLTVGELIHLIKKPVATYADQIVKRFHADLLKRLAAFGKCTTPADCLKKRKHYILCRTCKGWYRELELLHRSTDKSKISWRRNCDTSKWPNDEWEVAKFYMSVLGDNKTTVKNAESTDLSSLLNVLEWIEDSVFGGAAKRVDINIIKKFRSEVRNAWAHTANQEMSDVQRKDCFQIAHDFLKDLEKVANSSKEVKTCMKDVSALEADGVINVTHIEHQNLVLLSNELSADVSNINEELLSVKDDQTGDRKRIKELENQMKDYQSAIVESHAKVKKLEDYIKTQNAESSLLKGRLPDRLSTFIGRETEIKEVRSFLKKGHGVVSIYGGPGFGKSSIAVEVSHRVHDRGIPIIFSFLSSVVTVEEAIRRLCVDAGKVPGEDPRSTLVMWLRRIKTRAVVVLDNVEQLLEGEEKAKFVDLLQSIRKDSDRQLQILMTSTKSFHNTELEIQCSLVEPMDKESSVELLKTCCPDREFQNDVLSSMADLCGHVPLALRLLAAFGLKGEEDPDTVVKWLETTPMDVLDVKMQNIIKKSFDMMKREEFKKYFVRLAVFGGNFDREAAQFVLELGDLGTRNILNELEERSLLKRSGGNYSIHRLFRSFLITLQEFQSEYELAKELMVNHFLKECYDLTKTYWSKDGFYGASQKLKEKSHYMERMVNICQEAVKKRNENVVDILVKSVIYQSFSTSPRHFMLHILSLQLVVDFFECCLKVASQRKDKLAELNFLCQLAFSEGHKMGWESEEYQKSMNTAKEALKKLMKKGKLQDDYNAYSYFWYCSSKFLQYPLYNRISNKEENLKKAATYLRWSEEARKNTNDFQDIVYKVRLLKQRARIHKRSREYEQSENLYKEAIYTAEQYFGENEVTLASYKVLGDLYLHQRENQKALDCYDKAKALYSKLAVIHSSVTMVDFLKNRACCLSYLQRHDEAEEEIQEALDIAESGLQASIYCRAQVYHRFALVLDRGSPKGCPRAAEFAYKAIEKNNELMNKYDFGSMGEIIRKVERNAQSLNQ